MSPVDRSEGEPHDALTDLAQRALEHIEHDTAALDARAIVMVTTEDAGGMGLAGYDDDADALVDLLQHLQALLATNGSTLQVIPMPGPMGQG